MYGHPRLQGEEFCTRAGPGRISSAVGSALRRIVDSATAAVADVDTDFCEFPTSKCTSKHFCL